jgi:RNA methyltransferase, TrmH family
LISRSFIETLMSEEKIPQCYASTVERITSRQNPVVGKYRDAARGSTEDVLLDGIHLVTDALAAGVRLRHVMIAADARQTPEVAQLLERLPRGTDLVVASEPVMAAVSPVRSSSPVVALAARPSHDRAPFDGSSPLVVIICDVQDPGNVGAIVRVAEGAGASGAIVAGHSADPFGWKALRGSMGSALRLPIVAVPTIDAAIAEARSHAAQVVATVPRGGVSIFDSVLTGATALLVGGEGPGLPPDAIEQADAQITIPMESAVESLNAAVAAAVMLYEARRQRSAAGASRAASPRDRAVPASAARPRRSISARP